MRDKTKIRKYIQALLIANADVGENVFTRRPSPRFVEDLPAININYGTEPINVYTGDRYQPREVQKNLQMVIDVMVEDTVDPGAEPEKSQEAEDFLDALSGSVEDLLNFDNQLARLLEDYDPETGDGLSMGLRQLSSTPFTDDSGERRILLDRLVFEVPYIQGTLRDLRLAEFTNYKIYITNDGNDIENPNNIAREAEGDPRES